ncbi:hypothetical protein AB0362_26420, partial [Rhodococcus sp. NPDC079359]
ALTRLGIELPWCTHICILLVRSQSPPVPGRFSTDFCTRLLRDRLVELNMPATFDLGSPGTHSWPCWADQLAKSWPTLAAGLEP